MLIKKHHGWLFLVIIFLVLSFGLTSGCKKEKEEEAGIALETKTFLEKNAGDIGYLTICYGDSASAKAYHPKLKLRLTKTLMQGFDCCNHRYTWGS